MTDAPASTPAARVTDADTGADPATFAEGHLQRVKRLERQLGNARKWSIKATQDLHRSMLKEVKAAEQRARKAERRATEAEKRLAQAQRRARQAEAELETIKASNTWKAGRTVVAVPARIKRWGRSR